MVECQDVLIKLIWFLACLLRGAIADGPDIKDIKTIYEKSKPGEFPCYFDGSLCKRGEEFCSVRSKTCEPLFQHDATDSEKEAFCDKLIRENTTEQGMLDTCIYFFGKLVVKKGFDFKNGERDGQALQSTAGKELCPAANESYQLGNEFCNTASGKCDELFPTGATDDVKRRVCQEVIKNNVTERHDSCIYALGILCQKPGPVSNGDSKDLLVTIIVLLTAIILGAIILSIAFCKYKKCMCFKKAGIVHVSESGEPIEIQAVQNDLNKELARIRENEQHNLEEVVTLTSPEHQ